MERLSGYSAGTIENRQVRLLLCLIAAVSLAGFASEAIGQAKPVGTVGFDVNSDKGLEGILPVEIGVSLLAATEEKVTVGYKVTGGSATRGKDFSLADGELVFNPGQTKQSIRLDILADDAEEQEETIELALSNPAGATLAGKSKYTYTIIDSSRLHLKVDFGLPVWTGEQSGKRTDKPVPGTVKQGWIPWVSPRWADMYEHGIVQLEDVGGTGINMMMGAERAGLVALKVCGLRHALAGSLPPTGSPLHDPICNSWLYVNDWPDNPWADIILAIYNLPAGEYLLKSYHNHFYCVRVRGTDAPTFIDCIEAKNPQPPMPSIKAIAVEELLKRYEGVRGWGDTAEPQFASAMPGGWDYHGQPDYPRNRPLGPHGSGAVTTLLEAKNVQPQQVTRDEDLVPSEMKFRTDGSSVHIVYQAGCCGNDGVRPQRKGGRAILNAFELLLVRKIKPEGGENNKPK